MPTSVRFTPLRRIAAVTALTLVGIAAGALPASAHVTVSADDTGKGADDSILTIRVPNEMDNAVSMKLSMQFPVATPLAEVDPEPVAGYTITTKTVQFNPPLVTDDGTIHSGVGQVTWTANSTATGIPVGDFQAFRVLIGPLPTTVSQLAFPALQTYSNGQTISWTDPTTDPANPPMHPAALLALTAGDDDAAPAPAASSASGTSGKSAPSAPSVSASAPAAQAASPDLAGLATTSQADTGKTLGIIGIVLGAIGLLVGGAGFARGRRRAG